MKDFAWVFNANQHNLSALPAACPESWFKGLHDTLSNRCRPPVARNDLPACLCFDGPEMVIETYMDYQEYVQLIQPT